MRKQLLLFTLLLAFAVSLTNAQDTTLAVFDDGVLEWATWGAPLDIIANPDLKYNGSDSVALLDQTGVTWSGMAHWNDASLLSADVIAISADFYLANTGGQVKLSCDNSVSAGANLEVYANVAADTWTTVVFDITGSAQDYKQIAFQSGVADSMLVDNIVLVAAVPDDPDNLVAGGNMEYSAAWDFYFNPVDPTHNYGMHEFNYTGDTCNYGDGGSYRVSAWWESATFIWQPVTLKPNFIYEFTGSFKMIGDTLNSTWLELILTQTMPGSGEVGFGAAGDYGFADNTWNGAERLDADTTFQDYMSFTGADSNVFALPADAPTEWYVVVKAGTWQGADFTPPMDFIIDNVMLKELGENTEVPIENNYNRNIAIFPNPSTGIVNIYAESATVITLEVYNMAGIMIMSDNFTKNYQLDMNDANSGMYYILLKTADEVQVKKIIIQ